MEGYRPIRCYLLTSRDGENVQVFKDLKVTIDNYVFHSNLYALDMDEVDVILGYPWMDSIDTVNINFQRCFWIFGKRKRK